MGRQKVDLNGFLFLFVSNFLYVQVCAAVSFYIYNFFYLIGKVKILLNFYVYFFFFFL